MISVVIATFGDDRWRVLAGQAYESARNQTVEPDEIIHVHGDALHTARNAGAEKATSEWLIFLDADDTLDQHYCEQMQQTMAHLSGDYLLQPATLGVYPDGHTDRVPVVIPAKSSIYAGNWMVIGTAIRREQFLRLGGFVDLPAWEDWHLYIRAIRDGAKTLVVPGAIYRVAVRNDGRNTLSIDDSAALFQKIRAEFL